MKDLHKQLISFPAVNILSVLSSDSISFCEHQNNLPMSTSKIFKGEIKRNFVLTEFNIFKLQNKK